MTDTTVAPMRRFYDRLWNAWEDSAVDQTLAAEFTFRESLGQSTRGRDEWRAYRDGVRLGAPDFHNEVVDLIVDGNRAAGSASVLGNSHGPTARPATDGATVHLFGGGLLHRTWRVADRFVGAGRTSTVFAPSFDRGSLRHRRRGSVRVRCQTGAVVGCP